MGRKRLKKNNSRSSGYGDFLENDDDDGEPALLDFDSLVEASKRQPQKAIVQHHTQFIAPVERCNMQSAQLKTAPQQQVVAAGASLSVRLIQPKETEKPTVPSQSVQQPGPAPVPQQVVQQPVQPPVQAPVVQKALPPQVQAPKQVIVPTPQPALPAGIGQNLANDMQQLQDLQQELLHWGNKLTPAAPQIVSPAN
jgi:hypothetical protein